MEELLNNIFFQVFILTASIAGSFWYLKREQRKEDAGDAKKRIEDIKDTTKAVNDLNKATLEVLKENQKAISQAVGELRLQRALDATENTRRPRVTVPGRDF